jgi:hypothetical protein
VRIRNPSTLLGFLLLFLTLLAVGWATRFQYTSLKEGDSVYPVRINRYAGHTQILDGDWLGRRPVATVQLPIDRSYERTSPNDGASKPDIGLLPN